MKSFTKSNEENQMEFTLSLFIFLIVVNALIGFTVALAVEFYQLGIIIGFGLFIWEYGFLGEGASDITIYFYKMYLNLLLLVVWENGFIGKWASCM